MVAKTPTKVRRLVAVPPNPNLLREAIRKVDKCMARLQELQFTASGGTKSISGVNLSPRSTRGYLRTSIRCKQESIRLKKAADQISPTGKLPQNKGEWRQMSLPAMLVGETMAEILRTSRFAKEIVLALSNADNSATKEPITPTSNRRTSPQCKGSQSQFRAKRKMEKQPMRSLESRSPKLQRARSRIKFKASPTRNSDKSFLPHVAANRVSPKNRPWVRKTVLFPNPLFLTSPSSKQQKFCRTRSPVIGRARHQTPHKFIIKSPVVPSKIQLSTANVSVRSISPPAGSMKRSPKIARLRRSFSPARLVHRLASPLKNRISPLKNRIATQNGGALTKGLKQRPPTQFSGWKA